MFAFVRYSKMIIKTSTLILEHNYLPLNLYQLFLRSSKRAEISHICDSHFYVRSSKCSWNVLESIVQSLRRDVLKVYKECLRSSRAVRYSDTEWLYLRIKREFKDAKDVESGQEISHLLAKARYYLDTKAII